MIGRWLAAALWTAILLAASSDLFSSAHTGGLLRLLLHGLDAPTFQAVHFLLRKTGHLTAYGIATLLYERALARTIAPKTRLALALLMVLAVASIDEFHQSHIASRTGTPVDVAIDLTGGTIALVLSRVEWRGRRNC